MLFLKKSTLLIFAMLLMLTACGGNGGDGSNKGDGIESKCTIGSSKIGNCRL
jgi:hypothetical protein